MKLNRKAGRMTGGSGFWGNLSVFGSILKAVAEAVISTSSSVSKTRFRKTAKLIRRWRRTPGRNGKVKYLKAMVPRNGALCEKSYKFYYQHFERESDRQLGELQRDCSNKDSGVSGLCIVQESLVLPHYVRSARRQSTTVPDEQGFPQSK